MEKSGDTGKEAPPFAHNAPWLAPLAGFSDLPFRLLCREQGAACACTEMVSAKGLIYRSPGTEQLLDTCPGDAPLVVQLFGCERGFMVEATRRLVDRGYGWFDINAGCAVPKVVKTGAGAAMLRTAETRENLCALVREMTAAAGEGRVGVKFRLGWAGSDDVVEELGRALEDSGAGWLCLHPRRARQLFSGEARWEAIKRLKAAVRVPVLASGDLVSAEAAQDCVERTGADGVMFARGALADPRIFTRYVQHHEGRSMELPRHGAAVAALVRRHAALAREYGRGRDALMKMRTFAPRYLRGVPGAASLRKRLTLCNAWQELEEMLHELEALPAARGGGREGALHKNEVFSCE